jgi:hypothetical protein
MFIFVVQTLQKKWNEIHMKQLAGGKHMENDCFPRTLKFEMKSSGNRGHRQKARDQGDPQNPCVKPFSNF